MLKGFEVKGWDRRGQAGLSQHCIWKSSAKRKLFGKTSVSVELNVLCPAFLTLFGSFFVPASVSGSLCHCSFASDSRQAHKGAGIDNSPTTTG